MPDHCGGERRSSHDRPGDLPADRGRDPFPDHGLLLLLLLHVRTPQAVTVGAVSSTVLRAVVLARQAKRLHRIAQETNSRYSNALAERGDRRQIVQAEAFPLQSEM